MNSRRLVLSGVLVIGLAAGPRAMAGGPPGIALPVGHFSLTAQGTEASCSGSSCIVLNIIEAGHMIRDAAGNACGDHAAVVNTVPPSASPPIVVPSVMTVMKVTRYDPRTGTGDASLTEYSGGSCNGAIFDGTGATQIVTGTLHFTVSSGDNASGGSRIDSIVTALNLAGVGGFAISFTERQQKIAGNGQ